MPKDNLDDPLILLCGRKEARSDVSDVVLCLSDNKDRTCLVSRQHVVRNLVMFYVTKSHSMSLCLCSGVSVRLRCRQAGELASLLGGESLCWSLQEDRCPQCRLRKKCHSAARQGKGNQSVSVTH